MNYYEHHLGDYAEATAHLSFVEDAAYSRLMRKVYATEAPLPSDIKAVQRLVGARTKEEREAVAVVLEEFFELRDDGWHNARCDDEIAKYQKKAQHNREVGKLGGRPRKSETQQVSKQEPTNNPVGLITEPTNNPLQSPVPSNHSSSSLRSEEAPLTPKGGCHRFEDFWAAWPKNDRKQDKVKCAKKWRSDNLDAVADQILADIATKKLTRKWQEDSGQYVEAPLVYLNGRRWEDGVEAGEAATAGFV